jgi:hypothetical protein
MILWYYKSVPSEVRRKVNQKGITQMKHDPRKFDASIFKSQEEQEKDRQEAEAREYKLHERVKTRFGYCIITNFETSGLIRIENEKSGAVHFIEKRHLGKAEQLPPTPEIFISGPCVKDQIIEQYGHKYMVVETMYITMQEAEVIDEINDINIEPGPYAKAVLLD